MRFRPITSLLAATAVTSAAVALAAQAPALAAQAPAPNVTLTSPVEGQAIVIGTTTTIHYTVAGHAKPDPNNVTSISWTVSGKDFCYYKPDGLNAAKSGDFSQVASLTPRVDIKKNSCAGPAAFTLTAFNGLIDAQVDRTVYLKRAARWSGVNATPEPIRSGALVTITGTLERASWEDGKYHGFASTVAALQFKSTTGTAYKTYATTTGSNGVLVGHIHQKVSGCWRYTYSGSSTTNASTSGADCVTVTG